MFQVRTMQFHTGHGQNHEVGDVYQVEDFAAVENLRVLKFAELVESPQAEPPAPTGDTSVAPMTTEDLK